VDGGEARVADQSDAHEEIGAATQPFDVLELARRAMA
jgi:hypothetical protein